MTGADLMPIGRRPLLVLLLLALAASGCASGLPLMATPAARIGDDAAFSAVPPSRRTPTAAIVYATDRRVVREDGEVVGYDARRSRYLSFGTASVTLGPETWEELVEASTSRRQRGGHRVRLAAVEEAGHYPATPYDVSFVGGEVVGAPEAVAGHQSAASGLHGVIARAMLPEDEGRVFLYVHGYNNAFDGAAGVLAQFWHFAGRRGVPVLFTWPARSSAAT